MGVLNIRDSNGKFLAIPALKGNDGFSPIITESANNTEGIYQLDIETADGKFTTPNLKGSNGEGNGSLYIVNCEVSSETNGNTEVINYDGDFTKIKEIISNRGKVELRTNFNGSNYILEPSNITENYVTFNTVSGRSNITIEITENGIGDVTYIDLNTTGNGVSIDDNSTSVNTVWSSVKVRNELIALEEGMVTINDEVTSINNTWSSKKITNDYSTKEYVAEQIANASHLKREIVNIIPEADAAEENTIYMFKVESVLGDDKYQEWQLINGEMMLVGDTSIDLTGYAKINDETVDLETTWSSKKIEEGLSSAFDNLTEEQKNSLKGEKGANGVDGYSPTATVTQTDIGAVITITDESGTTTARVTNGADGKDGANGTNGKDGVSCTHSWNGTTLTVTSASGTSSVNLKGDKGDTGAKGEQGIQGEKGENGSDYVLTDIDKSEIATAVKADLTQLEPLFANSIEECTDISKVYVLPDGYIYAYMATATEGGTVPNFTNLMDDPNAYIKDGFRYSHSGQAFKEQATDCSIVIPMPAGRPVIRVRGAKNNATYNNYVYVSYGADDGVFEVSNENWTRTVEDNGDIVITMNYDLSSSGYATFAVASGVDIDDLIVTVNEEISYTTTEGGVVYDWKNTGHAFVPTDYEDRIINVENEVKANGDKISELENKINKPAPTGIVTMFISPTGDDSNDGLTASYPKKTVKACVEAGATRISAKRGTYNEEISLSNIDTLEIFPTDNNYTNKDVHRYPPIVFDTSDTIAVDSLVDYNAIKSVAYSKQNNAFSYVFTNGLYDTVYSTIHGYHSVIWLITDNIKTDKKLRPVASIAEVESNADTFTYIDNTIYLNADLTNVKEIRVPTSYNNAFTVSTANKVKLTEVEINFAGRYNLFIENCPVVEIDNCSVKYSSNGSGFDLKSANGILRNCYASRVHDGYGIGGCGHTIFIDCTAEWCFDDGMSHHTKCTGTVIGGRFEGNRKGGNVPAYGANVNIYGGLYKDNQMYGIAYITDSTHNPSTGMVQNAVIVDNDKGLVVGDTCNVTALNCSYSENNSDKDITGELIEY